MQIIKLRVVIDTGVLVSALLKPTSIPNLTLQAVYKSCHVFTSAAAVQELEDVLTRPKFNRYVTHEQRKSFLSNYRRCSTIHEVHSIVTDCSDPKDNKFLELALDAKVNVLIASDAHLTSLNPWPGIAILPPQAFINALERSHAPRAE